MNNIPDQLSQSINPNQNTQQKTIKETSKEKQQEYLIKQEELHQQDTSQENYSSQDINEVIKQSKKSTKSFRFHSKSSKCLLCGKKLSNIFILQSHLKKIHGLKPHGCKKCDMSFDTVKDLKIHIKSIHFKMTENQMKISDQGKKYIKAKVPNVIKQLQKETEEYILKYQKSNQEGEKAQQYQIQQNKNVRQLRRKSPMIEKKDSNTKKYQEEDEEKDSSSNSNKKNDKNNNNKSTSEFSYHGETGSSEDLKKGKKEIQKKKESISQQLHQKQQHQQQNKINNQLQSNDQKECKIKNIGSNTFSFSKNSQKLNPFSTAKYTIGIVLQSSDNNISTNNTNTNNSNNNNSSNNNTKSNNTISSSSEDSSNHSYIVHYKILKENKSTEQMLNQLKCMNDTCKYHNESSVGICEKHLMFEKRLKIKQDYSNYCQYFLPSIDENVIEN